MSLRSLVKLPSFQGVAAGQRATCDCPLDRTYHTIWLRYQESGADASEANIEADITAIRLVVDGVVQREITSAQLIDLARFYGWTFTAGYMPIFLSEPWRRTAQGEDSLAWGTADLRTLQIEVDIVAGATSPVLWAFAEVDNIRLPMGPIVKWSRFTVPVTATGINQWFPPRRETLYGIHAWSGDITSVKIERDQRVDFDTVPAALNVVRNTMAGFVPQTNVYSYKPDITARVGDGLPMAWPNADGKSVRPVAEFRVDFDMSAANSFSVLAETVGLRNA